MCDKAHRYTIEVIGETPRYAGTDKAQAVAALLGLGDDGEGWAVAEHDLGTSTSYCRTESQLVEIAALNASLEADPLFG